MINRDSQKESQLYTTNLLEFQYYVLDAEHQINVNYIHYRYIYIYINFSKDFEILTTIF